MSSPSSRPMERQSSRLQVSASFMGTGGSCCTVRTGNRSQYKMQQWQMAFSHETFPLSVANSMKGVFRFHSNLIYPHNLIDRSFCPSKHHNTTGSPNIPQTSFTFQYPTCRCNYWKIDIFGRRTFRPDVWRLRNLGPTDMSHRRVTTMVVKRLTLNLPPRGMPNTSVATNWRLPEIIQGWGTIVT